MINLNDNVCLVNDDCLNFMDSIPENTYDLILTDPPYGISFQSSYRSASTSHDVIINDDRLEWLPELFKNVFRVLKNDSAAYFFCSWHHVDVFKNECQKYFNIKDVLVWQKNNTGMGDLRGSFAPKHEFIIFCQKGRSLIRGKRSPNILNFSRTQNQLHPTQKPVDLCSFLIEKFSDPGDHVFDPFMGSGTTGISCIETGRKFTGVELDKKHFLTSLNRLGKDLNNAITR